MIELSRIPSWWLKYGDGYSWYEAYTDPHFDGEHAGSGSGYGADSSANWESTSDGWLIGPFKETYLELGYLNVGWSYKPAH